MVSKHLSTSLSTVVSAPEAVSQRFSVKKVFCKKGVLRYFAKFIGKHLCQRFVFNKVAGRACNFIKKKIWQRFFPVNFEKLLRTPFLTEHLWWLLLSIPLDIKFLTNVRLFKVKTNHWKCIECSCKL